MLTRRNLVFGAAAGACAALASRFVRERGASASTRETGPRYWLQLIPGGGVDAVLTTDPRKLNAVLPGVAVPYDASEIVEAKGMRLGPQFKALAPWSQKLAVINGVRVNTASHYTGMEQIVRLRTRTTWRSNSAFEILAAHRAGQTVGAVGLGVGLYTAFTPNFLGQPMPMIYGSELELFSVIDDMSPEELALAAKTVERHAASFRRSGAGSLRDRRRLAALEDATRLFQRLVDTPKFEKAAWWQPGPVAETDKQIGHSGNLQRALWLLENDLASSVSVGNSSFWDTHYDNDPRQAHMNPILAGNIARLFQELEARSNKYGKLSDQTAVVVGSEIGRLPYMNLSAGKDHFPQVSLLFFGKWFTTGKCYGDTDKELNSRPVSLVTGYGHPAGRKLVLDDVGTTVLRLAGLDPELYGFDGQQLDFLVRS